ncbi:MAG: FAD-binding oxidoreductase [Candidatus Wallbacteria bacterium]|nr:FAD-binding oxidoreductase [Candidatus Wallbacteria bacterium]
MSLPTLTLRPRIHDGGLEKELLAIFGEGAVSGRVEERIAYSRDLWPRGHLWMRQGRVPYPADWVVWPTAEQQLVRLVEMANRLRVPLVPYGAGSGVCGGTVPVHGGVMVDLKRMSSILSLEERSMLVRAQGGILGQVLETHLNARGFTMGHFPSSIYCSSLGGYLATRSAGQLSTRYGKIEDMVIGLKAVLASGEVYETRAAPRHATGPDLLQLLVGSEGTLGIITEGTMRLHRVPESRRFRGVMFNDIEGGMEAIRLILQKELRPAAVRLYDELDTFIVGGKSKQKEKKGFAAFLSKVQKSVEYRMLAWPELVGFFEKMLGGSCLLVLAFEGPGELTRLEESLALELCAGLGGRDLGPEPGKHWWEHRYDVSYRQSPLLEEGYFVDTFEVASTWDHLPTLYRNVRQALAGKVVVMAHFSHAYVEGCSIYFTFAGKGGDETATEALYEEVWRLAMETALASGATLSHHHGVGMSKAAFMGRQLGSGLDMLKKIKKALDPNDILNPGKLGFSE